MATEHFVSTAIIDNSITEYYNRTLLQFAKPKLLHTQFGERIPLPTKNGKTVKMRRYQKLAVATTPLAEGIPPTGGTIIKTDLTVTVKQYGFFIIYTDVLEITEADNVLNEFSSKLGDQEGETFDRLTRDTLLACAGSTTCSNGASVPTDLNDTDIDSVVQTLLGNDAEYMTRMVGASQGVGTTPIGDAFYGIAHTDLWDDLQKVSGWVPVNKYPNGSAQVFGEVGATNAVRWLMSTKSHQAGDSIDATYYNNLVIAKNAYGVVSLGNTGDSGGGYASRGLNSEMIIKPLGSAGSADPINQQGTIGWKVMGWACRILNEDYIHRLLCTNMS
jgi:N4-gp56 family major capsid protein